MPVDETLPTIVTFSENIADAPPPVPLPAGEYIGVVRSAEVKRSNKEKLYGAITYFISPDQYPPDYTDGNPEGTTLVYRRLGLEDTIPGRFHARKFCEVHGVIPSNQLDVSSFIGTEARLHIKHEMWEGLLRATIDKVSAT